MRFVSASPTRSYVARNKPAAETRAVNQSPAVRRCSTGTTDSITASGLSCAMTVHADSTAFSRTTVSSALARTPSGPISSAA